MPGNIINLTPADIAAWPKANYVDPYHRTWMPVYAGVLYGACTILVATRLWLRARKIHAAGLGLDDALLFCAWLSVTWFTVLAIVGSEVFLTSRHIWDIPLDSFAPIARITWIAELAFLITGCCVKVSVLCFYRRLVDNAYSRAWIWAVILAIVITISYTLAFILALIFNCTPTEAYWKAFDLTYTQDYHCVDTTVINLLAGIMAAVSDLYSVALPCLMMRRVQIPLHHKIALNVVFSTGLLVVAASVVRTYYLWEVGHSSDVSTCIYNVFVWSQLELTLGLMCASAPSLRVLCREYLLQPLSNLKRSVTPGRSREDSEVEQGFIRRVDTFETFEQQRSDFTAKHLQTSTRSMVSATAAEPDAIEAHPTSPKRLERTEKCLIKTPEDYEVYNLTNMEKYRKSAQVQQSTQRIVSRSQNEQELTDWSRYNMSLNGQGV